MSVFPTKWKDYRFSALLRLYVLMHHVCAVGPVIWKPVKNKRCEQDGRSLQGSCALRTEERHWKYVDKVGNVNREAQGTEAVMKKRTQGACKRGAPRPFPFLSSGCSVPRRDILHLVSMFSSSWISHSHICEGEHSTEVLISPRGR